MKAPRKYSRGATPAGWGKSVDRLLTGSCVRRRIRPIPQGRDVRQRRPLG